MERLAIKVSDPKACRFLSQGYNHIVGSKLLTSRNSSNCVQLCRVQKTNKNLSWDPEGIFKDAAPVSLFADEPEVQETHPPLDPDFLLKHPIVPLKGEHTDGIDSSNSGAYNKTKLEKSLRDKYMPINLNHPGVRIMHIDPPIFRVDGFWTVEQCQQMIDAARSTGRMKQSKVGSGNLESSAVQSSSRRTSSSVLVDDTIQAEFPKLAECAKELQATAYALLQGESLGQWGEAGKRPLFKQYCFEGLQVAEYNQGQFFMAHEDAFPTEIANENRFQRHATVLLYLNDVAHGGSTRFEHLNLAVKPKAGSVLVFFPSFSDGTPDQRTLHTAENAKDVKWVTQQWVSRGYNKRRAAEEEIQSEKKRDEMLGKSKRKIQKTKKSSTSISTSRGFG